MGFQRRVEDFTCANCGTEVKGTGYTNHCPNCLWSKHVDVMPGDRSEACGGMMEPVAVEGGTPTYRIVHRCTLCRAERRVTADDGDNADILVALAAKRE